MSILSDSSIEKLVEEFNVITPYDKDNLQPSSYDLTLGDSFIFPKESLNVQQIPKDKLLVIEPDDFILASTKEIINIPNYIVGRVEGKSSVARVGLLIHITAGYIDPCFKGSITLELKNIGSYPIALSKGCSICQISFETLDKECNNGYNSFDNHYQNQIGVTKSRYKLINEVYYIK